MSDPLARLEAALGHGFSDTRLLKLALTHRSHSSSNNERLEFLGDAVLNQVIATELFLRFETASEGELSRLRAQLVKGVTLAEIALELNLGDYLRLGSGELRSGGFRRESILADALEAVIGGVLLDDGYETCRDVIRGLFKSRLQAIQPGASTKDPKTRLQEYLQGKGMPLPSYELQQISGEDHDQHFSVACYLSGRKEPFSGEGSSRRRAEQAAAAAALVVLEDEN